MVVDLVLAGAIFALAGVLLVTKGNLTVTVIHKKPVEEIKEDIINFKQEVEKELTKEEDKFYKDSQSIIGAINELIYGKEERDGEEGK